MTLCLNGISYACSACKEEGAMFNVVTILHDILSLSNAPLYESAIYLFEHFSKAKKYTLNCISLGIW